MGRPGISVVIPTKGRVEMVGRLLASIEDCRKSTTAPCELIVVDSSEEREAMKIRSLCRVYEAAYVEGNRSVSGNRNKGYRIANYDLVAFFDSDCRATPGLLDEHIAAYITERIGGVIGVTEFEGPDKFMWKALERSQFLNAFSFPERMEYGLWGPCSNISFRKEALELVGGFDDTLPFALGGEDFDLGLRLNSEGYLLRCNPQAVVYHTKETWDGFREVFERCWRWGRVDYYLFFKKHPQRLKATYPIQLAYFFIFLIVVLQDILRKRRPGLALFGMTWCVLAFLVEAWLLSRAIGNSGREYFYEAMAILLGITFEAGTFIEALKNLDLRVICMVGDRGPVPSFFPDVKWKAQRRATLYSFALVLAASAFIRAKKHGHR